MAPPKAENTIDAISGLTATISNADGLSETRSNFPSIPFPQSQMANRTTQKFKINTNRIRNTSHNFRSPRKKNDLTFDLEFADQADI